MACFRPPLHATDYCGNLIVADHYEDISGRKEVMMEKVEVLCNLFEYLKN